MQKIEDLTIVTDAKYQQMSTAREIHVGTPAPDFPLEESVTVHFHVFANLTTEKDEEVCSPSFTLAGFEWNVCIYPGGNVISDEGMVAVYIYYRSPTEVFAE